MTKIRLLLLFFVLLVVGRTNVYAHIKSDSVRVLFIGNSYTYGNDLPELMAGKGIKFGYESVTVGGATLQNQWEDGKAKAAILRKAGILSFFRNRVYDCSRTRTLQVKAILESVLPGR